MNEESAVGGPRARFWGAQYVSTGNKLEEIRAKRGQKYGPVKENHETIGMQWGGILSHSGWMPGEPIPARIVCLMMVALKLNREAYSPQEDNIHDGINYLNFAGEIADGEGCTKQGVPDDCNQREAASVCTRQDGDSEDEDEYEEYLKEMYKI